jgi:hypothetical protein
MVAATAIEAVALLVAEILTAGTAAADRPTMTPMASVETAHRDRSIAGARDA